MSVLLVDIGNTRVKWAYLARGRLGRQHAEAHAGWSAEDFARRVFGKKKGISRILVSSVAGDRVNRLFTAAARTAAGGGRVGGVDAERRGGRVRGATAGQGVARQARVGHDSEGRRGTLAPEFVVSQREAGGVTTTYLEPWRLGVDRFAMAIGGHQLARPRPVCIAAVGTTLTIDLVDGTGRHLGGAILPSPSLMVDSLLNNTDGIRKRAKGGESGDRSLFARTTRTAIEQGALYAAAATVDRAAEEARWVLDRRPLLLVTGGGAADVAPLIRTPHTAVPDLVLQGLAVLAVGPGAPSGEKKAKEEGVKRVERWARAERQQKVER